MHVGRKRVARLMRQAGLKGAQKRRFRCTTRSGTRERWAPDLVDRQFVADRPNALWLADVTYVPTAEGFL
jgi:transposase InsO family protein